MMTRDVWRERIIEAVGEIASKSYQESAWFGKGKAISSPIEAYCGLFDDFQFEEFLNNEEIGLTQEQRLAGLSLKGKMDEYSELIGDFPNPREVLNDPQWHTIRETAQRFLELMTTM